MFPYPHVGVAGLQGRARLFVGIVGRLRLEEPVEEAGRSVRRRGAGGAYLRRSIGLFIYSISVRFDYQNPQQPIDPLTVFDPAHR